MAVLSLVKISVKVHMIHSIVVNNDQYCVAFNVDLILNNVIEAGQLNDVQENCLYLSFCRHGWRRCLFLQSQLNNDIAVFDYDSTCIFVIRWVSCTECVSIVNCGMSSIVVVEFFTLLEFFDTRIRNTIVIKLSTTNENSVTQTRFVNGIFKVC